MTVYATYVLEWTPDITLGWAAPYVDITSDAIEISWRRGRDYASQVVGKFVSLQATVVLDNTGGDYSSYVTVNMRPGRRVRLTATDATGTVTLWTGFLQRVNATPRIDGLNTAEMTIIGPLGYIAERTVDVTVQTSITTGDAVHEVLDAAIWPREYSLAVIAAGAVGYWRFGESSGNAIDAGTGGHDGAVTGATYSATGLLPGDTDTAFEFDGASGDVQVSSGGDLVNLFATGGSVEFWINADSDGEGNTGRVFDKNYWRLYVRDESGGAMRLEFSHTFTTGTGTWQTTDLVITVGQTHHVVMTYDKSDVANDPTFYIDGVAVAITETSTPTGTGTSDSGNDLYIGNLAADTRTFDGVLDEVAVYNTTLTPAQARNHAINPGLVTWRSVDDGQTTMTRWWSDPQVAMNALREIEDTELGFVWETRAGQLAFDDRNARLDATHQTSQATFSDAVSATLPFLDITQEDSLPFVFNDAAFPVQLYTDGSLAVMWTLAEAGALSPLILAGESATFWATFPSLASATDAQGVTTWTTPVATTDYTGNSQSDGAGTDLTSDLRIVVEKFATRMKIGVSNAGGTDAYITLLQARGIPFSADDPLIIRYTDAASQLIYGPHPYPTAPKFIPTSAEAGSLANLILASTAEAIPLPRIAMLANRDAAMLSEALRRDISDRITIVADSTRTRLGLAHDVFIESEEHQIDRHRTHTFAYQTSGASTFSDFWVWGFAEWDTTTKWAG